MNRLPPALALLLGAACASGPVLDTSQDLVWSQAVEGDLDVFARVKGQQRRLTTTPGSDFAGPVSPDGRTVLVLHSNDQDEAHQESLWAVSLDGLTTTPVAGPSAKLRNPRWLPDGSVVYESDAQSFRDLYSAVPGQPPTRLTASPHGCFEPAVSAAGGVAGGPHHAVVHVCSGADPDLWTVPSTGGAHRVLLQRTGEDIAPAVALDGTVAWLASEKGRLGVWAMAADGTGVHPVWTSPDPAAQVVPEQGLHWSPDGARLALVVRDGDGVAGVRVLQMPSGKLALSITGELPDWTAGGALLFTHEDAAGLGVFRLDDPGGAVRLTAPGGWLGRGIPRGHAQR